MILRATTSERAGLAPTLLAALLTVVMSRQAAAVLLPGGGARATDCYALLDFENPFPGQRGRIVTCVDGDPTCDHDGL